jgi:hypothetical protein
MGPAGRRGFAMEEYFWMVSEHDWNADGITREEHVDACARAEAWLTENEGDDVSISVRPNHGNRAAGLYAVGPNGHQILGYSIPVPERIKELTEQAWQHACETWPQ